MWLPRNLPEPGRSSLLNRSRQRRPRRVPPDAPVQARHQPRSPRTRRVHAQTAAGRQAATKSQIKAAKQPLLSGQRVNAESRRPAGTRGPAGPPQVAEEMTVAMKALPAAVRRFLTWDQGSEMAGITRPDRSRRGSGHLLLRPALAVAARHEREHQRAAAPLFPKGTDLSVNGGDRLEEVAAELNARPRKTLGWRIPAQAPQPVGGPGQRGGLTGGALRRRSSSPARILLGMARTWARQSLPRRSASRHRGPAYVRRAQHDDADLTGQSRCARTAGKGRMSSMSLIAILPVNSFRPFPMKSSAAAGSPDTPRLRNAHSKGTLPLCASYTHSTQ